jgi:hypothetical protein
MFGEPVPNLHAIGGFSILNVVQTNTLNGTNNGKYAAGVPTFQGNLGLDWETPWVKGLAVGSRVFYTGATFMDAASLQPVPAWTRVDLSASYTFERADGNPIALPGWLASAAAVAAGGAVAGGIVGALVDAGTDREHADVYAESVCRGGTLVTVRVPDSDAARAGALLDQCRPVDPVARGAEYRKGGWSTFDPKAPPYRPSQTEIDRMQSQWPG